MGTDNIETESQLTKKPKSHHGFTICFLFALGAPMELMNQRNILFCLGGSAPEFTPRVSSSEAARETRDRDKARTVTRRDRDWHGLPEGSLR